MENTSKKRKIHHEEEEDNEEEKIEKFFALIKSIREARDRLMNGSDEMNDTENMRKKRKLEEEKPVSVWNPSFQREDFIEEAQFKNPPLTLVGSSESKQGTEKEVKEGLDLRLSL